MIIYSGLSLIIGIALGLLPFLGWRLALPLVTAYKKQTHSLNISKFILTGILLFKFIIVFLILYLLVQLKWLNLTLFVVGLAVTPMAVIGFVLIFTSSINNGRDKLTRNK